MGHNLNGYHLGLHCHCLCLSTLLVLRLHQQPLICLCPWFCQSALLPAIVLGYFSMHYVCHYQVLLVMWEGVRIKLFIDFYFLMGVDQIPHPPLCSSF